MPPRAGERKEVALQRPVCPGCGEPWLRPTQLPGRYRCVYCLRRYELVARYIGSLLNPARVTAEDFRWLLSEGGEKEPRRVVEQFARWIRNDEMKCYATGFDFKEHFKDIRVPMAIFFGDLDKIAIFAGAAALAVGNALGFTLRIPL